MAACYFIGLNVYCPKYLKILKNFVLFFLLTYRGADKSSARPTSRYILFDGENISFDASLFKYI